MIAASVKQPNQLPDQARDTDPWTTAVVAGANRISVAVTIKQPQPNRGDHRMGGIAPLNARLMAATYNR